MENIKNQNELLNHREIQALVKRRGLKEEDYGFILQMAKIPKNVLLGIFHNFFSFAEEKSVVELGAMIQRLEQEPLDEDGQAQLAVAKIYKTISEKYDWMAANDLNTVFEEMK